MANVRFENNLRVSHNVLRRWYFWGADMKANNYEVKEAGETITFRGIIPRSLSQAFFLTFCTALGMLSLALVLQIQFQDLEFPVLGKPNWYLLAFLSPYAGLYYWRSGDRVDECSVRLVATDEDETQNEITVQGSEEELERMWRALGWQEKGMVKIEGFLDKVATS
jgi:Cofactor assembly of complex C subunit B